MPLMLSRRLCEDEQYFFKLKMCDISVILRVLYMVILVVYSNYRLHELNFRGLVRSTEGSDSLFHNKMIRLKSLKMLRCYWGPCK